MVGLSFHRLTPAPWIGRREEVADGLHSVQETMATLMCQTNGRREDIGVEKVGTGQRAPHSSGLEGLWCPKVLRNQDQPLSEDAC